MAKKKIKSTRKLERHFKGVSNHRRIEILLLVAKRPGLIQEDVLDATKGNQKTISEHIRRLIIAGLVERAYEGRMVRYNLTPYGKIFIAFINSFANLDSVE